MLAWIDLETTGLDPELEATLEVACVVTDDQLNEVARFERVIYYERADNIIAHCEKAVATANSLVGEDVQRAYLADLANWKFKVDIDPYVIKMHWDNGLWKACRRGEMRHIVDADLKAFLLEHAVKEVTHTTYAEGSILPTVRSRTDKPQLAGSTISFDRAFLKSDFPQTSDEKNGALHYRNCDVTTFNEVARRFWPEVHEKRPRTGPTAAHRAMADVLESLAVLRYYVANLGPIAKPVSESFVQLALAAIDPGVIVDYLRAIADGHGDAKITNDGVGKFRVVVPTDGKVATIEQRHWAMSQLTLHGFGGNKEAA